MILEKMVVNDLLLTFNHLNLIEQQFKTQHSAYKAKYPRADFQIVLIDGEQAGRLYVDRRDDELRILDFILLPSFRGQGIGSRMIGDLCAEARDSGRHVAVHIPRGWRAMRLAERLGFEPSLEAEHTVLMVWKPGLHLA